MPRQPASPAHGVAWVTGASSGIGEALSKALITKGWRVALSARSADKLDALAAELGESALSAPCDVAEQVDVEACADKIRDHWGEIGLVISNAGIYLPFEGQEFDSATFKKTVEVNLIGAGNLAGAVLPTMAKHRQGHFHLVSSATGFGGMPTCSAYGATKAALINMAECLKIEMDRYNVGISVSTPGFVDTPAQDDTPFAKPFMISAEKAANEIVHSVERGGFETSFPRRFTWMLKALYALPKPVYLPMVRSSTGWSKPPSMDA